MRRSLDATFRWNLRIAAESKHELQNAIQLYKSMLSHSIPVNQHTFSSLLAAGDLLREPLLLLQLHPHLLRLGLLHHHPHASSSLLRAYALSGLPRHALHLFDELPHSSLTLAALVTAQETSVPHLRSLHTLGLKLGFGLDPRLANSVVHAYARLGEVGDAIRCFEDVPVGNRDVGSWNVVISALVMNEMEEQALEVFDEMVAAGIAPSNVTLVSVAKCCGRLRFIDSAHRVHEYAMSERRMAQEDVVLLTAVVDMHARCGEVEAARKVFDGIQAKNVVCWSAMIAGYEQSSRPDEALRLFREMMREESVKPNAVTMLSVLSACSMMGAYRPAVAMHKYALETGLSNDSRVLSALIDMYAKCGEISLARKVFETIGEMGRTVVSCTAMIAAEGLYGEGQKALQLFSELREWRIHPNEVTFVALLSACSHSGLVEEGKSCFNAMKRDYGIVPGVKHYACVVDLLGRAGRLNEAHSIICMTPIKVDSAVWGCLLAACHVHGNCELGEVVEKKILEIDPEGVGRHVLLANMYCRAGRLDDVIRMRVELKKKKLSKEAGLSFIEVQNKVYGFMAEDRSHNESDLIFEELHAVDVRVRNAGYVKDTPSIAGVDHMDIEAREAFRALHRSEHHSERLAIAFGILMTRRGVIKQSEPIRITKNLRVCNDCHVYTKFVSKVTEKELIVRDSHRFHHFKDGICSCKDYW